VAGQFQEKISSVTEIMHNADREMQEESMNINLTQWHIRNFLECIRSRKRPNCDLETGHRSTTFAHLANIALATRSRLEWDPLTERFLNNDSANELLHYEYRKPWQL
jgi:hypothetical protein